MNPPTLSNAAIATLVVTKAFEKTQKMLFAENFPEQCSKLMQILQSEFPNTALNIKHLEELEEEQTDFNKIFRVSLEVEEAAKTNSEVAEAVQAVADVVNKQRSLDPLYVLSTRSFMYTASLEI